MNSPISSPPNTSNPAARVIKMHADDNVAIVVNDGGLPAGSVLDSGLVLIDKVPQGHKVLLKDLAQGEMIKRYNVCIGRANKPLSAGCWVHERLIEMPSALGFENLPIAQEKDPKLPPLEGYTCLLYTSPSPRDRQKSRMPSSA